MHRGLREVVLPTPLPLLSSQGVLAAQQRSEAGILSRLCFGGASCVFTFFQRICSKVLVSLEPICCNLQRENYVTKQKDAWETKQERGRESE